MYLNLLGTLQRYRELKNLLLKCTDDYGFRTITEGLLRYMEGSPVEESEMYMEYRPLFRLLLEHLKTEIEIREQVEKANAEEA